ncbi:MAG: hypothetical protein Q8J93_00390, partial [Xanthomonadales bacterium]|nr:hypothetical protein [Xanthomonadales bacterium]MDZ4117051.1 hypothetical protein [Xanthomonadaceae bacterium]
YPAQRANGEQPGRPRRIEGGAAMTSRTNEKPNFNATDAAEPINSNSSQQPGEPQSEQQKQKPQRRYLTIDCS